MCVCDCVYSYVYLCIRKRRWCTCMLLLVSNPQQMREAEEFHHRVLSRRRRTREAEGDSLILKCKEKRED